MDRKPSWFDAPWPGELFVDHENAGDMLGRLVAGSGSMLPQRSASFPFDDGFLFVRTRRSKLLLALSPSGDVRSVADCEKPLAPF